MSELFRMFKLVSVCVLVLALSSVISADDDAITSAPVETSSKAEEPSSTAATTTTTTTTEAAVPAAAPPAKKDEGAIVQPSIEGRALFGNLGRDFQQQQQPLDVQCKIDNLVLKSGESQTYQGECTQLTCHPDGMITGITCPFVIAPPGCQINPQDLSKPYPQCCETWTC